MNNLLKSNYGEDDKHRKHLLIDKNWDYFESINNNKIWSRQIKGETFLESQALLQLKHLRNLDDKLQEDIIKVMSNKIIRACECHFTATLFSLFIDDVKKVDGWYGYKLPDKDSIDLIRKIDTDVWVCEYKHSDIPKHLLPKSSFGVRIYDKKTKYVWARHCWNSYKDIHFDMTKDCNELFCNKTWSHYEYREFPIHIDFDINSIEGWITASHYDLESIYAQWWFNWDYEWNYHYPIMNMGIITNQSILDKWKQLVDEGKYKMNKDKLGSYELSNESS